MMTSGNQCDWSMCLMLSYFHACIHVEWFRETGDISGWFYHLRFQAVSWFLLHNIIEMGDDPGKKGEAATVTFSPILGLFGFQQPNTLSPQRVSKDVEHKPNHYLVLIPRDDTTSTCFLLGRL